MKLFTKTLLILTIFANFTFQSCSSDDDNPAPQNAETYIRFSIGDTDYNFSDILTAESGVITFNGNNGSGITDPGDTQIALWLPSTLSNGTFDVEDSFDAEYQVSFTSESLNFDFDFAESGTMTLTQSSGEFVQGSFNATITNGDNTTITITNGEFKAFGIE